MMALARDSVMVIESRPKEKLITRRELAEVIDEIQLNKRLDQTTRGRNFDANQP